MKVLTDIKGLDKFPSIITVGVFDGVHKGHKQVIETLIEEGDKHQYKKIVFTFQNHPFSILNPSISPPLLTTFEEKIHIMKDFSLDFLIGIKFDKAFSLYSVEDFIREILMKKLNMKQLVAGYDATFGKDRRGDLKKMEELGKKMDFSVKVVSPIASKEADVISSSFIRNCIVEGDMIKATNLLGRPYYIAGKVIHGEGLGRKYGFPTANISVSSDKLLPCKGVYAVIIYHGTKKFSGIANLGIRPTLGKYGLNIEVNIFDFNRLIYGEQIGLGFLSFIRKEKKFSSIKELYIQVEKDIEIAKNMVNNSRFNFQSVELEN